MHRSTYRKRGNPIQNLNQRTSSIAEYQTGRNTYIMMKNLYWRFMGRPAPVNEKKTGKLSLFLTKLCS